MNSDNFPIDMTTLDNIASFEIYRFHGIGVEELGARKPNIAGARSGEIYRDQHPLEPEAESEELPPGASTLHLKKSRVDGVAEMVQQQKGVSSFLQGQQFLQRLIL